ncbi:TadE/TadG family type IV pilus assembly protein, partial [Paenibacillus glucanolyticus]|uniref:TadE/TadG family type IV pilus assembly protein n=2 Tax=Paenibacillus glucanolyticus TaxID=59843 RepID=UPI003D06D490
MGKQGETKSSRRRKQGVRSSDGSVSVFLIIALAAVFMFVAIFIDYSRIAAMKVQSERLTRAAVRSVMSSYDPQLQKEYGLYAFGDSSGDLIMGNVLNDSLNPGDRSDAFRLMAMELDSSGLELQRPLGTYDIFNRQIIEDMKYKAPIDFTLELVNKFKPLSQSMKEASNTVDVLKQLRKLYDRREEALDEMLVKQRRAGEYAIKLSKLVMDPPGRSIYDASLGGSISTAADGASQYPDYKAKQQEDADRPPKEKLYTLQLMAYQNGISSIGSEISSEASRFQKEKDKLLEDAYKLWEEARNLNDEMKQVIKDSENRSSNKGYDQVTNDVTPGSTDSSGSEAEMIQSIRKQADKLVHSDELMNSFRQEIEGQESLYQQVGHAVSSLQSSLGGEGMKGAVLEASHALQNYISNYGTSGGSNIIDRQQAALEQFRTSDKERKAMERQANQKLKQATKVIEVINGLNGQHQAMLDEFRELQQYYDESLQFNAEADSMSKGKPLHDDPYEAGKDAMDNMDGMFGFMGNVLGGVRDELFQNEYAVHY